MNDDAGQDFSNQWNNMMKELGLQNIHEEKHEGHPLPRTYDRGKRCIDIIACSEGITNKMIKKREYCPFIH